MSTGFYLQDHPNPTTAQYGWERAKLGQPGQHLSGAFGVHTTENLTDFFGPDYNAENVAQFISTRADHGGYHVVSDADSIVLLVHPRYAAWADTTNNAHALSVSGSLQAARWLEMTPERRRQVVVNMGKAAAQIALIAVRDGYLAQVPPARRISAQHAINGTAAGFYGHGETNPGTRYDPGLHFDWNLFLSSYAAAVGGGVTTQGNTTTPEELFTVTQFDDLSEKLAAIHTDVRNTHAGVWKGGTAPDGKKFAYGALPIAAHNQTLIAQSQAQIKGLVGAIAALAKGEKFDEAKLLAGVQAAAEAGTKAALQDGTVDVNVTVAGGTPDGAV